MSPTKTPRELVMPPVVYRVPGMDDVRVHSNQRYSDVDNPHLLLDVYVPANLAEHERRPVAVLIHGSAAPEYRPKDWGIFQSWGRLIAASGMIGVTFTHRLGYPKPGLAEGSAGLLSASWVWAAAAAGRAIAPSRAAHPSNRGNFIGRDGMRTAATPSICTG